MIFPFSLNLLFELYRFKPIYLFKKIKTNIILCFIKLKINTNYTSSGITQTSVTQKLLLFEEQIPRRYRYS